MAKITAIIAHFNGDETESNLSTVCPLVAALDKFTNFKISAKICYKI